MNKQEHLLACLAEECAEIQQAVGKALRFGINNDYRETTPAEDIARECCDLLAVIELLEEAGIIKKAATNEAIQRKKEKVKAYMEYAKNYGTLSC